MSVYAWMFISKPATHCTRVKRHRQCSKFKTSNSDTVPAGWYKIMRSVFLFSTPYVFFHQFISLRSLLQRNKSSAHRIQTANDIRPCVGQFFVITKQPKKRRPTKLKRSTVKLENLVRAPGGNARKKSKKTVPNTNENVEHSQMLCAARVTDCGVLISVR